ncbi:nucleotidyl transferase AbiEii/AbiGii toxin family protein [Neolewinella sp.]|uniref:nucleotidyl transferase AbiEii/AbiGii toxin family protein n=1 Tax=Neolewinella sp. TaxID=2993543 RepID=UPI003B528021
MLHLDKRVLLPKTKELLFRLSEDPVTDAYRLVGGTSLAMQYGHRLSIDLDFFTLQEFDAAELNADLRNRYGMVALTLTQNTLIGVIGDIKVDFIRHPYPWLTEPIRGDAIVLATDYDIAAMKLNAIVNSGQRIKDFYDIYFLLEHFTMGQMIEAYETKYVPANGMLAARAVGYFGDIDPEREPVQMVKSLPFGRVQKRIEQALIHFNKTF